MSWLVVTCAQAILARPLGRTGRRLRHQEEREMGTIMKQVANA